MQQVKLNSVPASSIALTVNTSIYTGEFLTSQFELKPYSYANIGENIRTFCDGRTIKTRPQEKTSWTHIIAIENIQLERNMITLIDACEKNIDFISKIIDEHGLVEVQLRLSGQHNIGDVISSNVIKRLAKLNASLSIEVFPDQ